MKQAKIGTRAIAGLIGVLALLVPDALLGQAKADPVLLRYKAQPDAIYYEVNIATESHTISMLDIVRPWDSTHTVYDTMALRLEEADGGTLAGTYDLGFVQTWRRSLGVESGSHRRRVSGRQNRITRFEMEGTGDIGAMEGRSRAFAGQEIFRRLWQVPRVLPDAPVELGSTWASSQSVPTTYSHSTEIETRYEVVQIVGEDVWVEFSGSVSERLRSAGRVTYGTFTGRFGFRSSLGAMVAVEWNYEYRTGPRDRPRDYTETREKGSMVMLGTAEELPVEGVVREISGNRNDRKALLILGSLLAVMAAVVLGSG